jgi:arginyl-tRNA--protein-N-Asp/Glu arginylyltransferase
VVSTGSEIVKFGVTQPFACSYLPDRQEQLLVYIPEQEQHAQSYSKLIQAGFRRSGDQIYRPHCAQCNKCESIRVQVEHFKASKSQKRILNKNADLTCRMVEYGSDYFIAQRDNYYSLYSDYITERHQDGSMYPPEEKQFNDFIHSQWQSPLLLEAKLDDEVIAVAVTDKTESGFSAFYTFFNPHIAPRSLGTFMILQQIEFCQTFNLPYLYLGYQIDECRKMNYKNAFSPNQRFNGEFWV